MRILVTGANGFIGQALCPRLVQSGYMVRGAFRSADRFPLQRGGVEYVVVGDIGPETDWRRVLAQIDVVIHLAGRAHVMEETSEDPAAEYRRVNTDATRQLAKAAVQQGVRRLIFISTVKVNGEESPDRPFTEADIPHPADPYAVSKWEAEQALAQIAGTSALELVIFRLPLVYGPNVKGNFLNLLNFISRHKIFPLRNLKNRRSLLYIENCIDVLMLAVHHPQVANKTFFISDQADLTTPELIRALTQSLDRRCNMFPFPLGGLRILAKTGDMAEHLWHKKLPLNSARLQRLAGSLMVDSRLFSDITGWHPPYSPEEGLKQTAGWYVKKTGYE